MPAMSAGAALELLTVGVASTVCLLSLFFVTPRKGASGLTAAVDGGWASIHLLDGLHLDQQAHVVSHDVRAPIHAPA